MRRMIISVLLLLVLTVKRVVGQAAPAAPSTTAAGQPAATPAVQATPNVSRAAWFSDKRPLRVGDIVTIVVDEAVNSRESQTENASKRRNQEMGLNLNVGDAVKIGPQKGFESGVSNDSRATGVA